MKYPTGLMREEYKLGLYCFGEDLHKDSGALEKSWISIGGYC